MKYLKKIGFLIAVAVMVLSSCSKDDEEIKTPEVQDKPVLKENVKIIDATKLELDLTPAQLENGVYKFTVTGSLPTIKSGDLIVGEQGEGFLRFVSSATVNGNTITLQTTQATMSDLFKEGRFDFNLDMSNMTSKTSKTTKSSASGFSYTITNQSIYQDGPLSIVLDNGQVDFDPNWFFNFDFDKTGITNFEISTKNGILNGNFTATVTASQAITLINKSSSILPKGKPFTKSYTKWVTAVIPVGPLLVPVSVPVTVVMDLDLVLDYSATISAAITRQANFSSNNTFNLGLNYANGQWNDTNGFAPINKFTLSQRTGNANSTIDLALTPKVSFKLYGQAGPNASVSLKEQLSGSVASPALDWDFKADVWLKSTIGAQASILRYFLVDYSKSWETDKLSYFTPHKIEKVSGDNQVGTFGKQLTNPLKVRVLDNLDKPQANVPVYFKISSGGGKIQDASILTDANGFAETPWTLGVADAQTVSVSAKKADGTALLNSPISFTATSSYNPHKIEKVSGDNQAGTFGKQLTAPLKVRVLDNLDKPQANVPVNFTVSSGGGNVQTTSIVTDAYGFAETLWTLGASGAQSVSVSAKKADGTALLNSPLSFTATATASYNPYKIEKVSGDNQSGTFGNQLATPIKVRVLDNLDKPEANVPVNFTVSSGGGNVQTTSIVTDVNGFAQTLWTLGASGAQTVNVSGKKADGTALLNSPLLFTATVTAAPCDDTTTPYTTVTIGSQVWMQKNLNVCKYRNGDDIPQVQDPTAWAGLKTGAWCYYANSTANGTVYGKLYNYYAVKDPRGLAPTGYHIPTDAEWTTLTTFLGGELVAGKKMKAITGWPFYPGVTNTNSSGFSALPGGFRLNGPFETLTYGGNWWSASEDGTAIAWYRNLSYVDDGIVIRNTASKMFGFSVRCLRD